MYLVTVVIEDILSNHVHRGNVQKNEKSFLLIYLYQYLYIFTLYP